MTQPSRKELAAALSASDILKLRRDGYGIEHIAGVVKMSPLATLAAITDAVKELQGDSREYAVQIREIELQRLDIATKAIMPLVEAGDMEAINTLTKLQVRRSKYLGLDSPAQVEVAGEVVVRFDWLSPERHAILAGGQGYQNAPAAKVIENKSQDVPWKPVAPDAKVAVQVHRLAADAKGSP